MGLMPLACLYDSKRLAWYNTHGCEALTCTWSGSIADANAPYVQESFLDEGFILDKKIGVGQPKRIENAKILVANTAMDTDKIKIYGARVRVDSMQKV